MADELVVGPFGRLLPRLPPLTSRATSSELQEPTPALGSHKMYPRHGNSSNISQLSPQPGQGYQLPPFNQILNRHDTIISQTPGQHSGTDNTALVSLQGYGGANTQDRWRSFGPGSETGNASYFATAHPTHPHHGPQNVLTLPSLTSQQSSSSTSSHYPASTHPQGRRVLREENFPGRGICYVYEDGTICPKAVDGDSVNPQWGITKAGKPRKRLAQACTTCREKKIKCDPGTPKCIQCQKFGRECRFEPFSRNNPHSPSSPSVSQSPTISNMASPAPLHRDSLTSNEQSASSSRPLSSSKSSMTLENLLSPSAHDNAGQEGGSSEKSFKRRKCSGSPPDHLTTLAPTESRPRERFSQSPPPDPSDKTLRWEVDPYEVDSKFTDHYLHEYFNNTSTTTYWIIPRVPFLRWVRQCRQKSKWDRLLLYAMLAHGTIFATNSERKAHGHIFSEIAEQAASKSMGKHKLQIVQAKMILTMYNFALGNSTTAWDYCGGAIRAACGMRLNLERVLVDFRDGAPLDYGLSRALLVECRRRTFWSLYIIDRFNAFGGGQSSMLSDADCLLKLPCDEKMFESGGVSDAPYFEHRPGSPEASVPRDQSGMGTMGYMVQLASIWGDVLSTAHRSRYGPPDDVREPFEEFYQRTMGRLRTWEKRLPPHLRMSPENIDKAREEGNLSAYGALHTLHNCTMMNLNQHVGLRELSRDNITRNIRAAYSFAVKTLELMQALGNLRGGQPGYVVSSPFTGFAIITAVDILTARGTLADLLESQSRTMTLVAGSVQVLEELSAHWASAKCQTSLAAERYEDLMGASKSPRAMRKGVFCCQSPLHSLFGEDLNLVYSVPRRQYLEALCGTMVKEEEVLEIRTKKSAAAGLADMVKYGTCGGEDDVK